MSGEWGRLPAFMRIPHDPGSECMVRKRRLKARPGHASADGRRSSGRRVQPAVALSSALTAVKGNCLPTAVRSPATSGHGTDERHLRANAVEFGVLLIASPHMGTNDEVT